MTAKWPGGSYLHVATGINTFHRHATLRLAFVGSYATTRHFAQGQRRSIRPDKATKNAIEEQFSAKAALSAVQSKSSIDAVNPPRSTLPPPLTLPQRSQAQTVVIYWWQIGKAYGTFYKEGIKAVWYNSRAAQTIRDRITKEKEAKTVNDAAAKAMITRSEWQILERNSHDIGKLPLFGLLVLLFGEWLPLLVPFMPNAVPGTARIPKQVMGMRKKAEERRRRSFREGFAEPSKDQLPGSLSEIAAKSANGVAWPTADSVYTKAMLGGLRPDQLLHMSTALGLHSNLWDRIQLPPPSLLLRRKLSKRLQYLALDDKLLMRGGGAPKLSSIELEIACEERALDILGKSDETLRKSLDFWLKRQSDDKGRGQAMLAMLFRRLAIRDWVSLNLAANARD